MATVQGARLDVGRGTTVELIERELEEQLPQSRHAAAGDINLRIVQDPGSSLFADIWSAIAIGSAARAAHHLEVALWGLEFDGAQISPFWTSPGGFAAMQMASHVCAEADGRPIDIESLRRGIFREGEGIGDYQLERSRTIVEFDHDYGLAPVIAPPPGLSPSAFRATRRRLIDWAVLQFRRKLDLGALHKGITTQAEGVAGAVGAFIFELYDNADQYGRPPVYDRGFRMLRMRKHVGNNREELLTRAGTLPGVQDYLARVFPAGVGTVALIEASISDFGPGIVDGFLASPAGSAYKRSDRGDLLDRLIHERFGSRPADPASGRGLSNALEALSSMGGYASLRTGEFFAWASCAASEPQPRMAIERGRVPIAGTHWQLLWPMAL
jgi:hypothetical protein